MPGALQDLRVIDFTHALAGPFCVMLLGHLGADIIKVEPPNGDEFRRIWMQPGATTDAYESLWINVNKKSIVLNLKNQKGAEIARKLIARADVLVENYQKGVMERFGLDYDSVKALNPRLIYACSRGYGEWGPYANYGNTAASNNSIAGWTHSAWKNNGAPGSKTLGIGDEAAGVSIALGILAALHARERTGEGQKVEVSMQEAVLGFMTSSMHEHFTGNSVGNRPDESGRRLFYFAGAGNERCRLGAGSTTDRRKRSTARSPLYNSGGASAAPNRTGADRPNLGKRKNSPGNLGRIARAGLFRRACPVHRRGDGRSAYQRARARLLNAITRPRDRTTLLAPWIHLSKTPTSIHHDAPAIGQHTDEVLGGLGLTTADLADLRAQGVVK